MPGPEIETIVEMLRANPPVQGADVLAMRAAMAAATAGMPVPDDVEFEPVDAGGVAAEWTRAPGARDDRAVVYLHGGGYVMGAISSHRLLVADISRATGAPVLSVDYRLAPENAYPAAVEDATAAYRFALEQKIAPRSIAVGGDSAGGGLTIAALLALRDEGAELPGAAFCISPWADLTQTSESMTSKADEDPMVSRDALQVMADAYCSGANPETKTISPVFADLAGLPPLLIQVGTAEVLLDDARKLAANARAAGLDVTLEQWEGMIHVWHGFSMMLPEARQAIARIGEYLDERLG
ncbi:MAG: alpha/beta hydrolase [Myxococcales bacterium]|jgi:monoterpene epsilon-lactone hydrolase|nr:MAG: alpha/beta hydrolase [Myxococcales bacterium]